MQTDEQVFKVEVAYATPERQKIIAMTVVRGTTALQAAETSGIALEFPEIDFTTAKLGVFGKVLGTKGLKPADEYELQPRDRIEIYRPLLVDPKEVRRQRAAKQKVGQAQQDD